MSVHSTPAQCKFNICGTISAHFFYISRVDMVSVKRIWPYVSNGLTGYELRPNVMLSGFTFLRCLMPDPMLYNNSRHTGFEMEMFLPHCFWQDCGPLKLSASAVTATRSGHVHSFFMLLCAVIQRFPEDHRGHFTFLWHLIYGCILMLSNAIQVITPCLTICRRFVHIE